MWIQPILGLYISQFPTISTLGPSFLQILDPVMPTGTLAQSYATVLQPSEPVWYDWSAVRGALHHAQPRCQVSTLLRHFALLSLLEWEQDLF